MTLSAEDLTNMRAVQEGKMMDTCVIQAFVQTADSYNELVETWPADSAALTCGLDMRPGSERHGVDKTVLSYDATVRIPLATTPDPRDRLKVTKRHGETLGTPLVYNIVGPVQRGPSGNRLLLKRIEN